MPDSTTAEDCYALAAKYKMQFPPSVQELFDRRALDETPKSDDPAFIRARWWTVLSNAALLQAAKEEAERQGFEVVIDNSCDDWDYAKAADYLLQRLRELRQKYERVCLLSGGRSDGSRRERWHRRPQSAVCFVLCEENRRREHCILSAGSDGIDGDSPAAGAIVDGITLARAKAKGLDPPIT